MRNNEIMIFFIDFLVYEIFPWVFLSIIFRPFTNVFICSQKKIYKSNHHTNFPINSSPKYNSKEKHMKKYTNL